MIYIFTGRSECSYGALPFDTPPGIGQGHRLPISVRMWVILGPLAAAGPPPIDDYILGRRPWPLCKRQMSLFWVIAFDLCALEAKIIEGLRPWLLLPKNGEWHWFKFKLFWLHCCRDSGLRLLLA